MLTCLIVAGTLFVSDGPDSTLRNFAYADDLKTTSRGRYIYIGDFNYEVPTHLVGMSAAGIMNACAASATPDYVNDVAPTN
jgi:hypothetical protein